MNNQLQHIQNKFYYNLGLSIVDVSIDLKKTLNESTEVSHENNSKINKTEIESIESGKQNPQVENSKNVKDPNSKKKLQKILKFILEKKKKNTLYKEQQAFITDFQKISDCNNCNKADCQFCLTRFYGVTLLYKKEYKRKADVVFQLLKNHVESLRKKAQLISYTGNGSFTIKKNTVSGKQVDYLSYIELLSKKAKQKKELFYPSHIINISFLEFLLNPLALTKYNEITHPIYGAIGNYFIGKNEFLHSNKNIVNIFIYYKTEIRKTLIVLENQFSTNRSNNKSRAEIIDSIVNTIVQDPTIASNPSELKNIITAEVSCLKSESQAVRKKPNSSLKKQYNNEKITFGTTSDLQQLFPDTALSGVILFKLLDTTIPQSFRQDTPNLEENMFINAFALDDGILTKLSQAIFEPFLRYENKILLFSFHGFQIFHSNLAMISILTRFKAQYPLKNQFNFLQLSELTEKENLIKGIDFIKFCLYKYQNNYQNIFANQNCEIQTISKTSEKKDKIETLVFDFWVPCHEDESNDFCVCNTIKEHYKSFTITVDYVDKFEKQISNLGFSDENFTLIALRVQELLLFFQYGDFAFNKSNLQRDANFDQYQKIRQSMENVLID